MKTPVRTRLLSALLSLVMLVSPAAGVGIRGRA